MSVIYLSPISSLYLSPLSVTSLTVACQPIQTQEVRLINGSPLTNGGIIALLDHHLAPADGLLTIKIEVEGRGQIISDNKFKGPKKEDIKIEE